MIKIKAKTRGGLNLYPNLCLNLSLGGAGSRTRRPVPIMRTHLRSGTYSYSCTPISLIFHEDEDE